ncbi:hypothetical protein KO361_00415 [Candidatus Woesearchaeota archaeon]|nr:hypothetical protein [Candidatus Woesearchaeota archaeon]
MMFVVRCDRCGNDQKVAPRIKGRWEVSGKSKRCVYCGKTFKIHSDFSKTRIVRELPVSW